MRCDRVLVEMCVLIWPHRECMFLQVRGAHDFQSYAIYLGCVPRRDDRNIVQRPPFEWGARLGSGRNRHRFPSTCLPFRHRLSDLEMASYLDECAFLSRRKFRERVHKQMATSLLPGGGSSSRSLGVEVPVTTAFGPGYVFPVGAISFRKPSVRSLGRRNGLLAAGLPIFSCRLLLHLGSAFLGPTPRKSSSLWRHFSSHPSSDRAHRRAHCRQNFGGFARRLANLGDERRLGK
jgi:hypothetical protein